MSNDKNKAILAIISANVIFGLNTPVTKALMADWMSPIGYTMIRMFFGALVFWLIGSFMKRDPIEKKDFLILFIGGLLGYLGTQFFFSQALNNTTPVNFSLLMAVTPVAVLILSYIFLKEAITLKKALGVVLSISGAAFLILFSHHSKEMAPNNMLGIGFALLCVLAYASYIVLTRKISVKYQAVTIAKWMFLFSAVVLLPFISDGFSSQRLYSNEVSLQPLLLLSFSLVFSTVFAFFFMPFALKKLEAGTVSIFMNLQPIVASVVSLLVGQDQFSWYMILSAVLVISGAYLATRPKRAVNV